MESCADTLKRVAIWKRVAAVACRPVIPKTPVGVVPGTDGEMKAQVKSVLEQLKGDVDSIANGIDLTLSNAKKSVEDNWSRKLDIVPGTAILDEWYKKYGLRFDKVRDGPSIAALIAPDEIDIELRDFVNGLAR
jgi:hypothetical protein